MTLIEIADLVADVVVFGSYCVLSFVVFLIYFKFFKNIDDLRYSLLLVLTSLFLMLCALTHLADAWGGNGRSVILMACCVVSLLTAIISVYSIDEIKYAIQNRFKVEKLIKDNMILKLMNGYDLNIMVRDTCVLQGSVDGFNVSNMNNELFINEVNIGDTVKLLGKTYKVIHKMNSELSLEDMESSSSMYHLLGIDITEEERHKALATKSRDTRLAMYLNTAHDIKTPLTSISYLSEILNKCNDIHSAKSVFEELSTHLEMLKMLATQMSDAGKVLAGKELSPTNTIFNTRILGKNMENYIKYLKYNSVEFTVEISDLVPIFIETDEEWLWQIFINFINNAMKYTQNGYIKTSMSMRGNKNFVMRVEDSGIGISPNEINDIFDIFLNDQEKNKDLILHNKGVGLFTVATKVSALNGVCNVYHNNNNIHTTTGCVFEVDIPVGYTRDYHEMENREKSFVITKKTFLVVDDTSSIIRVMQKYLEGNIVDVAYNGKVALELMLSKEYDYVFMDLNMPVMGGLESTTFFRDKEKHLGRKKRQKIVMMSALEVERDDLFDDKLSKPFKRTSLLKIIEPT